MKLTKLYEVQAIMTKHAYTPEEVADLLQVHVVTVRDWLRDGTLIGTKIGRRWFVTGASLEKRLNSHEEQERVGKTRIRDFIRGVAVSFGAERNVSIEVLDWSGDFDNWYLPLVVNGRKKALRYVLPGEFVDDAAFDVEFRSELEQKIAHDLRAKLSAFIAEDRSG